MNLIVNTLLIFKSILLLSSEQGILWSEEQQSSDLPTFI